MRWIARYHHYLIRKGQSSRPEFWYFDVQEVAFPWWLPIAPLFLWAVIFDPSDGLRTLVGLGIGIPVIIGMAYASVTFLVSAIRTPRKIRPTK